MANPAQPTQITVQGIGLAAGQHCHSQFLSFLSLFLRRGMDSALKFKAVSEQDTRNSGYDIFRTKLNFHQRKAYEIWLNFLNELCVFCWEGKLFCLGIRYALAQELQDHPHFCQRKLWFAMGAGGSVRSRSRMTKVTPVVAVPVTKKGGNRGSRGSKVQKMVNKIQDRIAERQGFVAVGGRLNSVLEEAEDTKDDDETEPENHPCYVSTKAWKIQVS